MLLCINKIMLTNKYSKRYYRITSNAKQRIAEGYTETHHIIPQSLGGSNDKENLVDLTAREHFICHWLLIKMTEGEDRSKMLYALNGMRAENRYQERYHTKITARVYEKYRIEHAENHSKKMKGRKAWNKGLKLEGEDLEQHRERTRNRKVDPVKQAEGQRKRIAKVTGQKRSDETKKLMSLASKGKPKGPMSEEQKQIRSMKLKGVKKPKGFGDKMAERMKKEFSENNPNRRPDLQKTCEHCSMIVGPSNYARWHGDNCKKR
jgi:hypothetical protein